TPARLRELVRRALARRAPPAPPAARDRDSRLLRSWLSRHEGSVSRLELDAYATPAAAARALSAAARQVLQDGAASIFRSRG
ncbi:MAG TPA: hypothetical protein VJV23_03100, partial [Candidatus Polarisedimenticolia bacterium]|nr:hypothetical protein [Candidatus Polarisedimenticolia bacterium]